MKPAARFINTIDELPPNVNVCLYGAGDGGGNFKRLLDITAQNAAITVSIKSIVSILKFTL